MGAEESREVFGALASPRLVELGQVSRRVRRARGHGVCYGTKELHEIEEGRCEIVENIERRVRTYERRSM